MGNASDALWSITNSLPLCFTAQWLTEKMDFSLRMRNGSNKGSDKGGLSRAVNAEYRNGGSCINIKIDAMEDWIPTKFYVQISDANGWASHSVTLYTSWSRKEQSSSSPS